MFQVLVRFHGGEMLMTWTEGQNVYPSGPPTIVNRLSQFAVRRTSDMKLILTLVLVFVASFCSSQATNRDLRDVVKGTFSSKLYMDATKNSTNAIISPMSVKLILSLACLGAGGSTGSQITRALDLPHDRNRMKSGFQSLMQLLQSNSDMILTVANKLFIANNYNIEPTFLSDAQLVFQSGAENLDFQNNPESSTQEINTWVAAETNNTIQDLILQGTISRDTVMVMVNTLYLKASWKKEFLEERTTQQSFRVSSTVTKTVYMMFTSYNDMKYQQFDGYKAVEMPYQGDAVSMLVLLPDAQDGLLELEAMLKNRDWSTIRLSSTSTVNLWIPRFKLVNMWQLNSNLKELGMTEMFSRNANFTGISVPSPSVSTVNQKAFINVNEKGTTAAAATAIGWHTTAIEIPPRNSIEFRADHPFMFLIRETSTGAILFGGKVVDPEHFSA